MSDWREITPPQMMGRGVRCFQRIVDDGHLSVLLAREAHGPGDELRWHLSISHRSNVLGDARDVPLPGRLPNWDEIKDARYRFCPDQVYMAMILPPRSEYVNLHPTVMHLYEIDEEEGR